MAGRKARFSVILIVSSRNAVSRTTWKSYVGPSEVLNGFNLLRFFGRPETSWGASSVSPSEKRYVQCLYVCWMPVLSLSLPAAMALFPQGAPAILLGWILPSVPLVRELASVTLTLARALVCPTSRAGPVTVVPMDTGISSPAEDASHATVTPGPLTAATVTRQDALNFPGR